MCRNMCRECPWKVDTQHNASMIRSIMRWVKNGSLKSTEHRCHMISTDLWAGVSNDNICIGSKTKQNAGNTDNN